MGDPKACKCAEAYLDAWLDMQEVARNILNEDFTTFSTWFNMKSDDLMISVANVESSCGVELGFGAPKYPISRAIDDMAKFGGKTWNKFDTMGSLMQMLDYLTMAVKECASQ